MQSLGKVSSSKKVPEQGSTKVRLPHIFRCGVWEKFEVPKGVPQQGSTKVRVPQIFKCGVWEKFAVPKKFQS